MLKTSQTQLAEFLLSLADMVGEIEVGTGGGNNEMIERLSPYTKLTIGATSYLTPNAKVAFS